MQAQCYTKRRSHEKACAGGELWDVIFVLTQDLMTARNQLARLMKEVKPGGARLRGGDCGRWPPLQPIHRNYTHTGSNLPRNCHRSPPPGHFMCGKQYPHSQSPSRRPGSCQPVSVSAFGRREPSPRPPRSAPEFACGKPRRRALWSFGQPQPERAQYSCYKKPQPERAQYSCYRNPYPQYSCYEKPQPVVYSCERDFEICPNHHPRSCYRRMTSCRDGGSGLEGGGKRADCLGTRFATLLQDVTCQLRERRLDAAAVDAEVMSYRALCS